MERIADLYEAFIVNKHPFIDRKYFYNYIPKNYYEATKYALENYTTTIGESKLSRVKKILLDYHKRLGILTPKVEENIDNLDNGVVLAGHQAIIFGGLGLIANKIATVINISNISAKLGYKLTPVFFINTHDSFQPEISTIHMPVKQSGASKALSLKDYPYGVALNRIKTTNYQWLESSLSIIRNIFREFNSFVPHEKKNLFQERVDHIITFLRETYRSSKTLGEWSSLIWGIQTNILNDFGVVFIPSSNIELRKIEANTYKIFLEKREQYINEFNKAAIKIEKLGLKPTTPKRKIDYVPFFYECPNDGYRVNLSYRETEGKIILKGKCPLDNEEYLLSLDKNAIDFSDYAQFLSPRLDTNQATIQSFLPVFVRVSGPGEINYNAQVIPATRAIDIKLPLFVKYTRLLYNTPWIESIAKTDELKEYTLFTQQFFKLLGKLGKAKRKEEINAIEECCRNLTQNIKNAMSALNSLNTKSISIYKYKSWQFGMFDRNHKWQEVSWPWFIMASITGLSNYLATYVRFYSPYSLVGQIGYLNTQL